MLLAHELQHNETMLQLLMLVDGYELPASISSPAPLSAGGSGTVTVEAGEYEVGAPGRAFAYDNERPRHTVVLDAFEIDRNPVSTASTSSSSRRPALSRRCIGRATATVAG